MDKVEVLLPGIKVSRNLSIATFLAIDGGLKKFNAVKERVISKINEIGGQNPRGLMTMGKYDLAFIFDGDFKKHDLHVSQIGSEDIREVFSLPCVRIRLLDCPDSNVTDSKSNSVAFVFIRTFPGSPTSRYSLLLNLVRGITTGKTNNIQDKHLRERTESLLSGGYAPKKVEAYFTYSLYDFLLILSFDDAGAVPRFVMPLRNLLANIASDTSSMICAPEEESQGEEFDAYISIKVKQGTDVTTYNRIKQLLETRKVEASLSWQYGYYDLLCHIHSNNMASLHRLIVREIRELKNVICTATQITTSGVFPCIPKQLYPNETETEKNIILTPLIDKINRVRKEISGKNNQQSAISHRLNILLEQIEHTCFRLYCLRFRWTRYKQYLTEISVFSQFEEIIDGILNDVLNATSWVALNRIDKHVQHLQNVISS